MKKIGLLCLALVFALGTLGVGFASWSGVLNITGTVGTASYGAELSQDVPCTDSETGDMQDIGQCSCVLSEDKQTITITVTDAYPCYTCTCYFDVHSTGTMPIKITGITQTLAPEAWCTVSCGDDPAVANNTADDGGTDVLVGEKLHQSNHAMGIVTVHVEQSAPKDGASTSFTYEIEHEQAQ